MWLLTFFTYLLTFYFYQNVNKKFKKQNSLYILLVKVYHNKQTASYFWAACIKPPNIQTNKICHFNEDQHDKNIIK